MNRLIALLLTLLPGFVWAETTPRQDYPAAVKPIIENRCMVCHGCYDAYQPRRCARTVQLAKAVPQRVLWQISRPAGYRWRRQGGLRHLVPSNDGLVPDYDVSTGCVWSSAVFSVAAPSDTCHGDRAGFYWPATRISGASYAGLSCPDEHLASVVAG